MPYFKPNGQPALDSGIDDGGAAGTSFQQGGGNPAPDLGSSGSGSGGSSTVPGSEVLTFVSDDGSPAPTSTVTNAATTTQTVTFQGSGLVFNNTYTSAVSAAYQSCVLSAEQALASICTNSVTINVEFDAQAEGQNGELASNDFWTVSESYASLKSALTSLSAAEPTNTVLQQAVAHLPSTDPSGGQGFELPLAYAQILGLSTTTRSPEDIVTLNTSYNWSFGQDVINTLEHEISEGGMGRIGGLGDQNSFWSTMDLFRYNSSGQPDYTDGRDGRTAFFSYNGGATRSTLTFNNEFNSSGTKVNGGDTADFNQQDVFGTGDPGETNPLSATDMQVLEALGWAQPVTPTAEMIMVDAGGNYQIYDLGDNTILASKALTQIGTPWQAVGFGNFSGNDTADMLLRNTSTGAFQVDDVANDTVTQTAVFGAVGLSWSVAGFGKFDSSNYTDMMMRRNDGTYDVFTVRNNQIVAANQIAVVGGAWQTAGFGDFNADGTSDMLLRNSSTGAFEYYDIVNGQLSSAGVLGAVGLSWQVVGFGNFDNSGFSDMMMYDTTNGAYDILDIRNNAIVGAQQIAVVGSSFQVAGFADLNGDGTTDMLLRNSSTGSFEYYDIVNGQVASAGVLGQVGTQLSVSGVAPDTITSTSSSSDMSVRSAQTDGGVQSVADTLLGDTTNQGTDDATAPNSMAGVGSGLPAGGNDGALDSLGASADFAGAIPGLDASAQPQSWLDSLIESSNAAPASLPTQAAVPPAGSAANGASQNIVAGVGVFDAGAAMDAPISGVGAEVNNTTASLAANLLHPTA